MKWPFWKRGSDDPVAKLFFERYRLNLISIPREKASVCDVYVGDVNGRQRLLSSPGSAVNFLEPKFEIPDIITEDLTDIHDTTSDAISANVGLEFLEIFLNVLGGGNYGTKIRGKYEQKGTHATKIRFDSATQDRVDRFLLGDNLSDHKIKEGNAAILPGQNYYIVVSVARAKSISIIAEGESQKKLDLEADVSQLASGSLSVSKGASRDEELTYTSAGGIKTLAFGVELCELIYSVNDRQFLLPQVTESFRVKGENTSRTRKVINSALIGDALNGSMFVDID